MTTRQSVIGVGDDFVGVDKHGSIVARATVVPIPPRFSRLAPRWHGRAAPGEWRSLARRCIPNWYHFGMSKQIAVRLPDELVAFIDDVVESGSERSRAAVVARALERERRA